MAYKIPASSIFLLLTFGFILSQDRYERIFCHKDFSAFVKCLRKEGSKEIRHTMDNCTAKLDENDNEKLFYRQLCNNSVIRYRYMRCAYERLGHLENISFPQKCIKTIGLTLSDRGKKTQSYFCSYPGRYKCFRKRAPYEDLKIIETCQHKTFPEVDNSEFNKFMCEMSDQIDLKRLGDFRECYINKLREAGRPVPPKYAQECRTIEKGAVLKAYICVRDRYKCFRENLPENIVQGMDRCMKDFFPSTTNENLNTTFCVDNEHVNEKVGLWAGCVVHEYKQSQKGSLKVFVTKCT